MHYFGDKDISADYFGLFSEGLKQRIDPQGKMVGIMSHGCSGDIYRVDYKVPGEGPPEADDRRIHEGPARHRHEGLRGHPVSRQTSMWRWPRSA
jgi:hypothetical protein